jgi:hypothetical protein
MLFVSLKNYSVARTQNMVDAHVTFITLMTSFPRLNQEVGSLQEVGSNLPRTAQ